MEVDCASPSIRCRRHGRLPGKTWSRCVGRRDLPFLDQRAIFCTSAERWRTAIADDAFSDFMVRRNFIVRRIRAR
jgi:hypothetical protein